MTPTDLEYIRGLHDARNIAVDVAERGGPFGESIAEEIVAEIDALLDALGEDEE